MSSLIENFTKKYVVKHLSKKDVRLFQLGIALLLCALSTLLIYTNYLTSLNGFLSPILNIICPIYLVFTLIEWLLFDFTLYNKDEKNRKLYTTIHFYLLITVLFTAISAYPWVPKIL